MIDLQTPLQTPARPPAAHDQVTIGLNQYLEIVRQNPLVAADHIMAQRASESGGHNSSKVTVSKSSKVTPSKTSPDPEQAKRLNDMLRVRTDQRGYCPRCASTELDYVGQWLHR